MIKYIYKFVQKSKAIIIFLLFFLIIPKLFAQSAISSELINLSILNTENDEFAPSYNKFQNF